MLIQIPDRTVKTDGLSKIQIIRKKLDMIGFALFSPAAVQFLLALEWGGTRYAWNSARIIGLFCGSAGTLCVFLAWEYRKGDSAMIPFSMVRRRTVWCSCLVMSLFMASMITTSYYIPIYFQAVRNKSPTMSGVYILPAILSQVIFATISGVLGRSLTTFILSHLLTMISWQTWILSALERY